MAYPRGVWGADARSEALTKLKVVMSEKVGARAVFQAAAEAIREAMSATSLSIVMLDEGQYRDVVNVGAVAPEIDSLAQQTPYAADHYPLATQRLLSHVGYIGSDPGDDILNEYKALRPQLNVGSIMGVPIVAQAEVSGEIFLMRDDQLPVFTRDDLEMMRDLATTFASRLPILLASYAIEQGTRI